MIALTLRSLTRFSTSAPVSSGFVRTLGIVQLGAVDRCEHLPPPPLDARGVVLYLGAFALRSCVWFSRFSFVCASLRATGAAEREREVILFTPNYKASF